MFSEILRKSDNKFQKGSCFKMFFINNFPSTICYIWPHYSSFYVDLKSAPNDAHKTLYNKNRKLWPKYKRET